MPDRVEKVARAIGECKDVLGQKLHHVRSESEVRAIAIAALAAAEPETTPVVLDQLYGIVEALRESCSVEKRFEIAHKIAEIHKALAASPPIRDEAEITATVERELVACLEADGIECDQEGHAWTADVSKRTEIDVTGLAVAIATAIRARGER